MRAACAPAPRSCCCMYQEPAPGPRPPSSSGLEGSTITLAGSNAHLLPSPWHSSQAPYGLLNENERGSSCGTLVPHSVQASFCEYRRSSPFTTAISTSPPASLVAVSMDASRRFSIPGFTSSRSTTTSMVWFLPLVERDLFVERPQHAVDARAHEALPRQLLQVLLVFALAPAHDRRQHHDAVFRLAAPARAAGSARWSGARSRCRTPGSAARRSTNTAARR